MLTTANLKTLLFTRLRRFLVHAAFLNASQKRLKIMEDCRDDFVWKSIYCKPSCSEMLKRPDHELLVRRWTQCHPSLWNMQCLYFLNESLWDYRTNPLLWFWFYQSCSPSLKNLPFCIKCLLIQQNQWKLKTKSIVFWPAMLSFALYWWGVDPACHTGYWVIQLPASRRHTSVCRIYPP